MRTETIEVNGYELSRDDEVKRMGNVVAMDGQHVLDKRPEEIHQEAAEQFMNRVGESLSYESVDEVYEALRADAGGTLEDIAQELEDDGHLQPGTFFSMRVEQVLVGSSEAVESEITLKDWKTESRITVSPETLERHLGETLFVVN